MATTPANPVASDRLKGLEGSAAPRPGKARGALGGLKSWLRRKLAKAALRGTREIAFDPEAFPQETVTAIKGLLARLESMEHRQRASADALSGDAALKEAILGLRKEVADLRAALVAGSSSEEAASSALASGPEFGQMYAAFEAAFRGPESEIERRLQVYLPNISARLSALEDPLWLDLGCGRGEWLRCLTSLGIRAKGVDSNAGMVARAHAEGLDAEVKDLFEALVGVPSGTLGGLSAFHVIEHLEPPVMMRLLHEAMRVLRPGGLLLLETPNPENLDVGANTFHLDPTHKKPVPPLLLEFLLTHLGWEEVEILRLQADPPVKVPSADWNRVERMLTGPRDYGMLARRP
ncbi:MAG TPA: class I SAM-dependent methyltransferase [Holophagaceae bacterium]|nr:class I SAM-dependent methyltransferase [Holophagaceae bacterium]